MEKTRRLIAQWMHRIFASIQRIPMRWRLALVSLGLLVFLISGLGLIILLTAEKALLSNQSTALYNEARLAVSGIRAQGGKGHPFSLEGQYLPPASNSRYNFQANAQVLVTHLAGVSANAAVLSPNGDVVIASSTDAPLAPPRVLLTAQQVRQYLSSEQAYMLARDVQGQRQLVVLLPLMDTMQVHTTIGILQISTPTAQIDSFMTTLRLILIAGIVGALGIAITLTFPLIGATLRPLVDIERTSRRIAAGELSMRLDALPADDEIGQLALSFNRMVDQLESSIHQQKQFVADVSHELRTPLTALHGSMEMLLIGADRGDPEASRRLVRGMYAEVQRMQRLVEDLLALTRLDEGKVVMRMETFEIHTLLDNVYDQAQQLSHGQDIQLDVAPVPLFVRADRDRLQQVLLNVVDNAIKYSSEGIVEIAADCQNERTIRVMVRDTGKGIPPEAVSRVFDRFYRADPARSRSGERVSGNGLGLAIAKDLIEAQGGTISLISTVGEGTIVTLLLQRSAQTSTPNVLSESVQKKMSLQGRQGL